MAHAKGLGRWQVALVAGLVATSGCGAGPQPGATALSEGEVAAAAKAIALTEVEIARRARALLTSADAIAYIEAFASSFGSANAAVDAAASRLGLELTPSQTSQVIDAYLAARQSWLGAGSLSDAAFLAQMAQDLAWLLDLLGAMTLPENLPPALKALLDQLAALIDSYRDLAGALAEQKGVTPGAVSNEQHRSRSGSWGRAPVRSPAITGANYGTSAYQQK
ncbi:MAG: hypothetical protein QM765_16950 [Myxococcales bacterium]